MTLESCNSEKLGDAHLFHYTLKHSQVDHVLGNKISQKCSKDKDNMVYVF